MGADEYVRTEKGPSPLPSQLSPSKMIFAIGDGKIVSLTVIFNQPSPY